MVTTLRPAVLQRADSTVWIQDSCCRREPDISGGVEWLRSLGVEVIDLDSQNASRCLRKFIASHPEVWNEDIGEE